MTHLDHDLLLAEACEWTSSEEHARVTAHLDECPECLDRFAGYCADCAIVEAAARPALAGPSKLLLAPAILPFALILGAIVWNSGRVGPASGQAADPPAPPAREAAPPPAREAQEEKEAKDGSYAFLGLLHPSREVSIFSKIQAHVERVDVGRGSRVRKGDLLIQLKAPELESLAEEARVRTAQDEADVQRTQSLVSKGLASAQELDVAKSRLALDKARLSTGEANLSYLKIVAPFAGIIADRAVEEGSLVGSPAGSAPALLLLQDIDRLRLTVSIPASSKPTLDAAQPGARVSFVLRDRPDKKMNGAYLGSTRTIDPATGTFSVDVEVDNASLGLLPGTLVLVAWPPPK